MRMLSLLTGTLLAGCAGQESAFVSTQDVPRFSLNSHAPATHMAYALDRDPEAIHHPAYWPFNQANTLALQSADYCLNGEHYRLVARISPFDRDLTQLPVAQQQRLRSVAQTLLNQPQRSNSLVVGHTDAVGSAAYNQQLSEQRAATVARWFMTQGLSAQRIQTLGYGERSPLQSLAAGDVAPHNRRVEVFTQLPSAAAKDGRTPCMRSAQPIATEHLLLPVTAEVTP
ncbi:OmpA family protein [uncultured Pseudomonas sp.]|uniref:OmpA family protein n=1 Tax=uncultured Pseudomonas sp. TaxID=114707 RepID=UPI0026104F35|nr:OmpA family protein [uncultured Pseudomonas sp.]